MNCRDAERLIDTFFDGELEGRLMRDAALHVTRCKRCEGEIVDREALQDILRSTIEEDLAATELSQIWQNVEAATFGSLEGRRDADSAGWLRLAAASSRMSGVLLGRRPGGRSSADRAFEAELDPAGEWLQAPRAFAPRRALPLAGMTALAASLLVAVLLTRGNAPTELAHGNAPAEVARASAPAEVARANAPSEVPQMLARATSPLSMGEALQSTETPASQVEVESVDYAGRSLAMWSEPESDTTVIWIDDEESPSPGQR